MPPQCHAHLAGGIPNEREAMRGGAGGELVLVLVCRQTPPRPYLPQPHEPAGVRADADAAHQRHGRHCGQLQCRRLGLAEASPTVELRLAEADALALTEPTFGRVVRVGDRIVGEELAVKRRPKNIVLRACGEVTADAARGGEAATVFEPGQDLTPELWVMGRG